MQPFGNGRHPFDRLGGIFRHEFFELPANGIGGFIDHVGEFVKDPFERGQEGMGYDDWWYRRAYIAIPVQNIVGKTLMSFKDFPPRQKPASFTIDQAMEALLKPGSPSK